MKVGLVYPQVELRGDPQAVHDIGVGAEQLGFDSLLVYDHVVGAEHDDRQPPLWGPYTERDPFHEPLVMFGYLAAVTSRIELATGVMILPQRQTALVAQQVADADLFSRERVRLGVGTGWNYVEYDTLGQDFATRGPRLDEQIELLRHLWSQPLVTFQGRFDRVERACINPRPRRLIPIWIGGFAEPATGGAAGSATASPSPVTSMPPLEGMARVRHHMAEAGRSADAFGFELIATRARSATEVTETAERWRAAGGTHVSVLTIKLGLDSAAAHLDYASLGQGVTRRSSRSIATRHDSVGVPGCVRAAVARWQSRGRSTGSPRAGGRYRLATDYLSLSRSWTASSRRGPACSASIADAPREHAERRLPRTMSAPDLRGRLPPLPRRRRPGRHGRRAALHRPLRRRRVAHRQTSVRLRMAPYRSGRRWQHLRRHVHTRTARLGRHRVAHPGRDTGGHERWLTSRQG